MNNTIESSKFFPYVAWTLVIGFSLFTYSLVVRVNDELTDISESVSRVESKIDLIGSRTTAQEKALQSGEVVAE
jgi:hypothetical protein